MIKNLLKVYVLAFAVLLCGAAPALAYQETKPATPLSVVATNTTPVYSCPTCHGLESGVTSPTVAKVTRPSSPASDTEAGLYVGSRKGPHGGYTSGTQKCQTCHTIHDAGGNLALLPQPTISATCNTCHDGTGGGGVYGVIQYRTGVAPAAQHRIDLASINGNGKVTVPGGDPTTGGSIETTFTGVSGGLTCTDCHSPHNSNTVKPFEGDRVRSIGDTSPQVPTNRLLLAKTTKGTTAVTEYGSDWCEQCHPGRHAGGLVNNHPVAENADGFYYRKVNVLSAYNTSTVSAVSTDLGGSNLGYIMPTPHDGLGNRTQPAPICQQCHEDARAVGNATQFQVSSTTESFTVNADGVGGGNPRFQNFPHETQNPSFLLETGDSLCLNCHDSSPN